MHLKRLQSQTEPWARKQKEEEREEADKTGEWGCLRRCGKDSWAVCAFMIAYNDGEIEMEEARN